ncbi:MAG: HEPN domain-containing protein [Acidobacteria bacterium]|nr:HEPN domain-containing protein [Acidobacteriota bacterium]
MREREHLIAVCAEWVAKAENDLTNAAHALTLGEMCPTDTVCFHAQQCVEKYLKAILVLEGIDFPKTHDLETLVVRVPARLRPGLTPEEQARLTEYATGARYPGWEEIPLAAARRAVAVARRVRRDARRTLPRNALRRQKPLRPPTTEE